MSYLSDVIHALTKSSADSAYSKFDPYLFNTEGKYPHNKEKLFNEWGYTIREPNSQWFSPRFFARIASAFSAIRQYAEKSVCDPDKKPTGENCFASIGKNFS